MEMEDFYLLLKIIFFNGQPRKLVSSPHYLHVSLPNSYNNGANSLVSFVFLPNSLSIIMSVKSLEKKFQSRIRILYSTFYIIFNARLIVIYHVSDLIFNFDYFLRLFIRFNLTRHKTR